MCIERKGVFIKMFDKEALPTREMQGKKITLFGEDCNIVTLHTYSLKFGTVCSFFLSRELEKMPNGHQHTRFGT